MNPIRVVLLIGVSVGLVTVTVPPSVAQTSSPSGPEGHQASWRLLPSGELDLRFRVLSTGDSAAWTHVYGPEAPDEGAWFQGGNRTLKDGTTYRIVLDRSELDAGSISPIQPRLAFADTGGDEVADRRQSATSANYGPWPSWASFPTNATREDRTLYPGGAWNQTDEPDNPPAPAKLDFGDAWNPYPTSASRDGARHASPPGAWLGSNVTVETHALAFDHADDGLVRLSLDEPNAGITVEVTNRNASGPLFANALVDLNRDGDWEDRGEHIVQNDQVNVAPNTTGTANLDLAHDLQGLRMIQGFVVPSSLGFHDPPEEPGPAWIRVTLSETPVQSLPWDGRGRFQVGETEDYLRNLTEDDDGGPPTKLGAALCLAPDWDAKLSNGLAPPGKPRPMYFHEGPNGRPMGFMVGIQVTPVVMGPSAVTLGGAGKASQPPWWNNAAGGLSWGPFPGPGGALAGNWLVEIVATTNHDVGLREPVDRTYDVYGQWVPPLGGASGFYCQVEEVEGHAAFFHPFPFFAPPAPPAGPGWWNKALGGPLNGDGAPIDVVDLPLVENLTDRDRPGLPNLSGIDVSPFFEGPGPQDDDPTDQERPELPRLEERNIPAFFRTFVRLLEELSGYNDAVDNNNATFEAPAEAVILGEIDVDGETTRLIARTDDAGAIEELRFASEDESPDAELEVQLDDATLEGIVEAEDSEQAARRALKEGDVQVDGKGLRNSLLLDGGLRLARLGMRLGLVDGGAGYDRPGGAVPWSGGTATVQQSPVGYATLNTGGNRMPVVDGFGTQRGFTTPTVQKLAAADPGGLSANAGMMDLGAGGLGG